jgi:hypothetical protein
MPNNYGTDTKADRRQDIEKAAKKPKKCPTCGKPYGGSNTGGASMGGGAG